MFDWLQPKRESPQCDHCTYGLTASPPSFNSVSAVSAKGQIERLHGGRVSRSSCPQGAKMKQESGPGEVPTKQGLKDIRRLQNGRIRLEVSPTDRATSNVFSKPVAFDRRSRRSSDDALCQNSKTNLKSICRRCTWCARIVSNRTQLICQMRAFCLEYGIAMRQGSGGFQDRHLPSHRQRKQRPHADDARRSEGTPG